MAFIGSIKEGGNLFQRECAVFSPSLDHEDVEVNEFKSQPYTVDQVVLPTNVVQSDWIDVLILKKLSFSVLRALQVPKNAQKSRSN